MKSVIINDLESAKEAIKIRLASLKNLENSDYDIIIGNMLEQNKDEEHTNGNMDYFISENEGRAVYEGMDFMEAPTMSDCLAGAFGWSDGVKTFDYWANIHSNLEYIQKNRIPMGFEEVVNEEKVNQMAYWENMRSELAKG